MSEVVCDLAGQLQEQLEDFDRARYERGEAHFECFPAHAELKRLASEMAFAALDVVRGAGWLAPASCTCGRMHRSMHVPHRGVCDPDTDA